MNILTELNTNYAIDSLTTPLPQGSRFHWIFSGQQKDFTLSEISYLEETIGPTIVLSIGGTEVRVPGAWNILVVDTETYTIDAIPVTVCGAFEHSAFVFSPDDGKLILEPIKIVGWEASGSCFYPAVEKANGVVHAISSGTNHGKVTPRGVIVSPSDMWRYLNGCTVGDVLG